LIFEYPSDHRRHVLVLHSHDERRKLDLRLARSDIWPDISDLAYEVMTLDLF
jgi:hypothetical protein